MISEYIIVNEKTWGWLFQYTRVDGAFCDEIEKNIREASH